MKLKHDRGERLEVDLPSLRLPAPTTASSGDGSISDSNSGRERHDQLYGHARVHARR